MWEDLAFAFKSFQCGKGHHDALDKAHAYAELQGKAAECHADLLLWPHQIHHFKLVHHHVVAMPC